MIRMGPGDPPLGAPRPSSRPARLACMHISEATLFCSQISRLNHGITEKPLNYCAFSQTGGLTKNLEKPKEIQPSAGESGRCAPSSRRAAGNHSRAPHARKAAVPCLQRGCGDRRQARTKSWSSETLEIHWENKGKPARAQSLPQAPWCFPAIGDSMPCQRFIAMREAQANSPEPHSGSHSSHCSRTCRKL